MPGARRCCGDPWRAGFSGDGMPRILACPVDVLRRLARPWFIYRPGQVFRAAVNKLRPVPEGDVRIRLPWGAEISAPAQDYVGYRLRMHGVMALEACEAVWRLVDLGERVVDVGANVGEVTSAMAARVGTSGRVVSVEMMPETFKRLENNARGWSGICPDIVTLGRAVSDRIKVSVGLSPDYARNSGVAYVSNGPIPDGYDRVQMDATSLDDLMAIYGPFDFLKLDVETHEYHVLLSGDTALRDGALRDIVFEDTTVYESPAKEILREHGYQIFRIDAGVLRPILVPVDVRPCDDKAEVVTPVDFLATREPRRALVRFAPIGYRCLRPGAIGKR